MSYCMVKRMGRIVITKRFTSLCHRVFDKLSCKLCKTNSDCGRRTVVLSALRMQGKLRISKNLSIQSAKVLEFRNNLA